MVLQGLADGHVTVQCHGRQQQGVQVGKGDEEVHLGQAVGVRDSPRSCYVADQQLGDQVGGEADVHKGEIGKEEVHGGVQAGIGADDQDDECVPGHGDQVCTQEEPKEDLPLLGVTGDAKQEELADSGPVLLPPGHPTVARGGDRLHTGGGQHNPSRAWSCCM